MGWWKIGKRQEMMGDLTADEMTRGLGQIAAYCKKEGKQLPSSGSYIGTIADIIASEPKMVASPAGSNPDVAAFRTVTGGGQASLEGEPRKILAATLKKISDIYQNEDGVRPQALQLFANFHFVVSDAPSQYLSDEAALKGLKGAVLGS
jgi:hypothetical protein